MSGSFDACLKFTNTEKYRNAFVVFTYLRNENRALLETTKGMELFKEARSILDEAEKLYAEACLKTGQPMKPGVVKNHIGQEIDLGDLGQSLT